MVRLKITTSMNYNATLNCMMHELPTDFPHEAPSGYRYRTAEFKPMVTSIWCDHLNHYNFNSGATVSTIWGFVKFKTTKRGTTHTYHAPINSNKIGKIVALDQTSAYSAMPLLKLSLDPTDDTPSPAMIDSSTKDSTMTTTPLTGRKKEFSDYCAQKDAQNTLQLNVTKWCFLVCDALRNDYMRSSYVRHKFLMPSSSNPAYHQECLDKIDQDICDYDFYLDTGRKYHKIMMNAAGSHSVHAFVDKKTGEMYKAASIKQPAKGVRFDLRIITQREEVLEKCDWAGSYLYR